MVFVSKLNKTLSENKYRDRKPQSLWQRSKLQNPRGTNDSISSFIFLSNRHPPLLQTLQTPPSLPLPPHHQQQGDFKQNFP
jgi:hypothetical protein